MLRFQAIYTRYLRPGPRARVCGGRSSRFLCATHGVGYQIYYEENGAAHSIGYGPEAADRTYTIEFPKPAPSVTSTPAVQ